MKVNAPADATYEWAGKQRNTVALGLRIGLGMGVSVDWERLELDLVGRSSGATIVQPIAVFPKCNMAILWLHFAALAFYDHR